METDKKKVLGLSSDLKELYEEPIKGTEYYTGIVNPLGISNMYNSPLAQNQFLFALALSGHDLVQKLLEEGEKKIDLPQLAQAKVLENMKILDLGCGPEPTFARLTRYLGADTYTVDLLSSNDFSYRESEKMPRELRELEIQNHIQGDLEKFETLRKMVQETGGNFDLVTEAHLSTITPRDGDFFGFEYGDKFSIPFLKEGGAYYDGLEYDFKVRQGQELIEF